MIGAVFPSCLFWPLLQTLNYGWDVSSRGLSPHQVPIRFLSARGTHTAAFLWGPSFFFSLISLVSSWVVALTLISLWPPSFCLRVLYLEFSSLRRYHVYIWVLPSPSMASLLYQQGLWLSHLLCQSGWSITTVTVSLVISPVRPVSPLQDFPFPHAQQSSAGHRTDFPFFTLSGPDLSAPSQSQSWLITLFSAWL